MPKEPKYPCLSCGKPVPKSRRDKFVNDYKQTLPEGEHCSSKCWKKCLADCAADAASEARYDLQAELQQERNADAAYHMAHGE